MNRNIDTGRLKCYTVVILCILRKRGSTMAKRVQFVLTDAEYGFRIIEINRKEDKNGNNNQ